MPDASEGIALVLSTLPDEARARKLARQMVEERLIACGSVVPGVTSVYRWGDAVEETPEVMLLMKTRNELVGRLRERVLEIHPYEVPEVIALRATDAAEAYRLWVRHETIEVNG